MLINFNEEVLDFHENFKIFLTTRINNPNFLPDIFIRTNVINFTVTPIGLEEQLLAEVMKIEKPEVEIQKNENIEKVSSYQKKMKEFENQILNLLAESNKSPVEDKELVETLQFSKRTAEEIKIKMENTVLLNKKLQKTREIYRPVANRGSILFFVIADIGLIDPMY